MFCVYSKYIKTRKINYLRCFDNMEDAIHHIYKCYEIDKRTGALGEYYYYVH